MNNNGSVKLSPEIMVDLREKFDEVSLKIVI